MGVYKEKKNREWTGKWFYQFVRNGQVYKQKGFRKKKDGEQAEREKRLELESPTPPMIPTASFQELTTKYLDHCYASLQKNTSRQKARVFRLFIQFLGQDIDVADMTPRRS